MSLVARPTVFAQVAPMLALQELLKLSFSSKGLREQVISFPRVLLDLQQLNSRQKLAVTVTATGNDGGPKQTNSLVSTLDAFYALRSVELVVSDTILLAIGALLPVLLTKKTLTRLKLVTVSLVRIPLESPADPCDCFIGLASHYNPYHKPEESKAFRKLQSFKSQTSLELLHIGGLKMRRKTIATLINASPKLRTLRLPFVKLLTKGTQPQNQLRECHSLSSYVINALKALKHLELLDFSHCTIKWAQASVTEHGPITDMFQSSAAANQRILAIDNDAIMGDSTETVRVERRDVFQMIRDGNMEAVQEMVGPMLQDARTPPELILQAMLFAVENTTSLQVLTYLMEGALQRGFSLGTCYRGPVRASGEYFDEVPSSKLKLKTNVLDTSGFNLVHAACAASNADALRDILLCAQKEMPQFAVSRLLQAKTKGRVHHNGSGMNPLEVAVKAKSEDCVRALLKFGASLRDAKAVKSAAHLRLSGIVTLLLEQGSEPADAIVAACSNNESSARDDDRDPSLIKMLLTHTDYQNDTTDDDEGSASENSSRAWKLRKGIDALNAALPLLYGSDKYLLIVKEMVALGGEVLSDGLALSVTSANKQLATFNYVYAQLEIKHRAESTGVDGLALRATRTVRHLPVLYHVLRSVCMIEHSHPAPANDDQAAPPLAHQCPMLLRQLKLIETMLSAGAGESAATVASFGDPISYYLKEVAAHTARECSSAPYRSYALRMRPLDARPIADQRPMHRTGLNIEVLDLLLKYRKAAESKANHPTGSTPLHRIVRLFLQSAPSPHAHIRINGINVVAPEHRLRDLCIGE
jgi:hypothetical protein